MRIYDEEGMAVVRLVAKIEEIVAKRQLNKYFHRVEIEKILFKLFQGEDVLNPYERRETVDDYEWEALIKDALTFLCLRRSYEKLYKK